MTALSLRDVRKNFGATEIIRGVTLDIASGERHCMIGPNGAGKTTCFNLISGRFSRITSGEIRLDGERIDALPPHRINRLGLSRSFQITSIFHRLSVFENLRCALLWGTDYRYSFWSALWRQKALNEAAEKLLEDLNLASRRDVPAGLLSYAEQRALEIGMTMRGRGVGASARRANSRHEQYRNGLRNGADPSPHPGQDIGHGGARYESRLRSGRYGSRYWSTARLSPPVRRPPCGQTERCKKPTWGHWSDIEGNIAELAASDA